ncbi:hypothetical protein PULV_a6000, partial [Pseudoalteromonas ulvae UL12]|uniref:TubC N-terminal docking domain-related protein n=1 Tax=Pseudoalteromonas ulvae TaxID=107327 RepID=UPI0019D85D5C
MSLMIDLVEEAYQQGVLLFSKEGKLGFKLKGDVFPAELKSKVLSHKEELIAFLEQGGTSAKPQIATITPNERPEVLPLGYAQQRIWFVNEFGGGSDAYNMVSAYEVVGQFDVTRAERALNE